MTDGPDQEAPPTRPASGWVLPTAPIEVAPGLIYAGIGRRLVAWFLDGVIVGLVTVVLSLTVGAAIRDERVSSIVLGACFVALSYSYYVWSWTARRATPGMRLMSLQIGTVDGANLSVDRATVRWAVLGDPINVVAYVIPSVVDITTGFVVLLSIVLLASTASSPMRQGLHDRAAGSLVVQPAGAGNLGWVVGIVVVLAGIVLISLVSLIFLGGQVSRILSNVGRSI